MEQEQGQHLKAAIEALLFVSEKPITLEQFKEAIPGISTAEIKSALQTLCAEYQKEPKGMQILEIAGGWQMLSHALFAGYIRDFYKTRHQEKLSRPALEVLAIIAYKQPVSRTDIEVLRGVNSDGIVMHLLHKGLIKIAGRKEVLGRPYIYATTQKFLEYFGLRALEDLPKLEEFPLLMESSHEVAPTTLAQTNSQDDTPSVIDQERLKAELAQASSQLDTEQMKEDLMNQAGDEAQPYQGEMSGQARSMNEWDHVMKEEDDEVDESETEN